MPNDPFVFPVHAAAKAAAGSPYVPSSLPRPALAETVVTQFQSGHGYVKGGAGTQTDDTNDFVIGTQSVQFVTNGANASGWTQKSSITPTIDATGKQILLWVKVDNPAKVNTITLYASSDNVTANYYSWVLSTANYVYLNPGEWAPMIVNFGDAVVTGAPTRNALNSFRLLAKDDGTAAITVHWGGLSLIPEPANGVVSLCFDDNYTSHWTNIRPKLDQYRMPASTFPIIDSLDVSGSITTAQLKLLRDVSNWEVCAHDYALANHATGHGALPLATAETDMLLNKQWLAAQGCNGADILAYGLGTFNAAVIDLARKYFVAGRTIDGSKTNKESYPPADRMRLRAWAISQSTLASDITAAVTGAVTNKQWLILVFHNVVAAPAGGNDYSTANFATVIDAIASSGIKVKTIGDVLRNGVA